MKLLIITQKVDINDPVLGFFHRWIEEFAKKCELVTVICLEKGKYDLPKNAKILSLGKEEKNSKVRYIVLFYKYIWQERENYDAVFVHMNPEYVLLGGLLWRLWRRPTTLWYTHKYVDLKLSLATFLVDMVFTASKESFRLKSRKVNVLGHGIDVDFFSPDLNTVRSDILLSVGRLMPSKRHDLVIETAGLLGRKLRIAGAGPDLEKLEVLAHRVNASVEFLGGLTQQALRDEYRKANFLIHTSETGSLDKVVLEALSCGLPVITTSVSLASLPVAFVLASPQTLAEALIKSETTDTKSVVLYVQEHHSLERLIPRILESIQNI